MSDPFDKLLMPKVERVYNLRIDIVTKRKESVKNVIQQTTVKNVIQQTNQQNIFH